MSGNPIPPGSYDNMVTAARTSPVAAMQLSRTVSLESWRQFPDTLRFPVLAVREHWIKRMGPGTGRLFWMLSDGDAGLEYHRLYEVAKWTVDIHGRACRYVAWSHGWRGLVALPIRGFWWRKLRAELRVVGRALGRRYWPSGVEHGDYPALHALVLGMLLRVRWAIGEPSRQPRMSDAPDDHESVEWAMAAEREWWDYTVAEHYPE